MNRDAWEFPYTADVLLKAAYGKVEFHTERITVWEKAQEETKQKIRDSGLHIDEGVDIGPGTTIYNSRNAGPQVTINDEMLRHLNEAIAKVRQHRDKIKDYGAWAEVLASQGQASFPLNHDDWLFFFGK